MCPARSFDTRQSGCSRINIGFLHILFINLLFERSDFAMNTDIRKKTKFSLSRAILSLLVTLGIGSLGGFLARGGFEKYGKLDLPPLAPPPWVFPVVWSALYILMSVGVYLLLSRPRGEKEKNALTLFAVYMVLNFLWPLVFFEKRRVSRRPAFGMRPVRIARRLHFSVLSAFLPCRPHLCSDRRVDIIRHLSERRHSLRLAPAGSVAAK